MMKLKVLMVILSPLTTGDVDVEIGAFQKLATCQEAVAFITDAEAQCVEPLDGKWNATFDLTGGDPPLPPDPDPPLPPDPDPDPDPPVPDPDPLACAPIGSKVVAYDPNNFDNVLEGFERTTTLRLIGPDWDNTLVRDCKIHDTGADGILMRDVSNVVITGCEIWNTGDAEAHRGIKVSGFGNASNVVIDGNELHDIPMSGIYFGNTDDGQFATTGLKVINNVLWDVGLSQRSNGHHPIYLQTGDFLIEGNVISGRRGAHGISVRSSGVVRCNDVSGTSLIQKLPFRYFSDHDVGDTNLLLVEHNTFTAEEGIGLHIYKPVPSKSGLTPPDNVVKNFVIRNNDVNAPDGIVVAPEYFERPDIYSVVVEDNVIH